MEEAYLKWSRTGLSGLKGGFVDSRWGDDHLTAFGFYNE